MLQKSLWLAALLPITSMAASTPTPAPGPSAFPYPMKVDKLANGLTVTRVQFPSPGLIAYSTLVRVGSRNEVEPGHTGFAHFFEHMMFRGTERYPAAARESFIQKHGYTDNAYTSADFTFYFEVGPTSELENLINIESDRFQNLSYAEPEFQTEAKAVLGEYHKNAASPGLKVQERLAATAFTHHPYSHTTLGYYKDIQAMPTEYQYSKDFFHRWYAPQNAILFIVGDFDDAKVMAAVESKYGNWKSSGASVNIPKEPPQKDQRTAVVEWNQPTLPRLYNGWHTPGASLKSNDAATMELLAEYLAGPTSPLHKSLVLDKQWAESVDDDTQVRRDPHLLLISVTLKDPSHLAATQKAINTAVKDLVTGKVDKKRFEAIKSNSRYSALMALNTAQTVAEALAHYASAFGTPDALGHELAEEAKAKPEQMVAFAKRYLVARNRTILTLKSTASMPSSPGAQP